MGVGNACEVAGAEPRLMAGSVSGVVEAPPLTTGLRELCGTTDVSSAGVFIAAALWAAVSAAAAATLQGPPRDVDGE